MDREAGSKQGVSHRELMLNKEKISRYKFLRLPPDLQDRIIKGLDARSLTLNGATHLAAEEGEKIHVNSISRYYHALRRERKRLLIEIAKEKGDGE
jgi:hypothetical protein